MEVWRFDMPRKLKPKPSPAPRPLRVLFAFKGIGRLPGQIVDGEKYILGQKSPRSLHNVTGVGFEGTNLVLHIG
jgi:hypothetical protein